MNRFYYEMIEVIQRHHGIIVDFLGDDILAFFDPLDEILHTRCGKLCDANRDAAGHDQVKVKMTRRLFLPLTWELACMTEKWW